MKTLALLCGLLFAFLHAARAQANSPAARPGYFGTRTTTDAASPAPTQAAGPVLPNTQAAPVQPSGAARDAKTQAEAALLKRVTPLLQAAREKILTTKASYTKTAPLASAEAALEAIKKTDGGGRYRGHRAKAIGNLNDAIAELKTGDKAKKANGYLGESIAEVELCEATLK